MPVRSLNLRFLLLVIICTGFTGCTVFSKLDREPVPTEEPVPASQATFVVEIHPNFGKPTIYRAEITKPTTIQTALDESGASGEFSSMTVDLYRQLPDGRPLKLPVEFKKNKQVKYEQDYSLHPNDRIIVRPKPNSPFDKLVDQVFGEL